MARFLIAFYDGFSALLCACLLVCAFPAAAFAYIDPSVMTYTIQAVAGIAVALSAVAGVVLRRGRKVLMGMLDIDEDAHREFEGDIHRAPHEADAPKAVLIEASLGSSDAGDAKDAARIEEQEEASSAAVSPGDPEKPARRFLDRRSLPMRWRSRFAYGLAAAFFLIFTVFFAAPLEVVAGSASSLVYGIGDLWWVLAIPGIGLAVAIALFISVFRGRAFTVVLVSACALGLCGYVQGLALNVGLPAADGASIYWGDYMAMQVASSLVWLAIIVGFVLIGLHNRLRAQGIVVLVSACLVIVQGVGLAGLAIAPPSAEGGEGADEAGVRLADDSEAVMTEDGLFSVNAENNVIVFVLDTFDDAYLKRVMKMDAALLDEFTGFTSYENCTGSMIPTRFAVPQMLTGQMPSADEPFSVYKAERYERGTFLDAIDQAGYSIGLYTDSLTIGDLPEGEQRAVADKTMNVHELSDGAMDIGGSLCSLYQIGLYRDVLWPFKWAFWYYTDQINASLVAYDPETPPEETIYVMDDVRYYERLCARRLDAGDAGETGAFRFIHLLGAHYPFDYDENVDDLGQDGSDVFKQSRGALRIVSEYLRQLKELGLYDGATIIVTADHGYWTITEEPIEETSTPIMFVKPAQTAEEAAQPIVVDEKPVSQLDLQATILDAMGLDWSEYARRSDYPGYSMFTEIDPGRRRRYLTTDSLEDLTETQLREYEISGNALDFDNWRETGLLIDAQK